MMRKAVLTLVAAAFLGGPAAGADVSLLVFTQLARAGTGDLNRTIAGLRDWCAGRSGPGASFDCTLDSLRWFPGGGAALQWRLTPRLSLGLGAEVLTAEGGGGILTDVRETESGVLPNGDLRTAVLTERTSTAAGYALRAVPVTAFAAWTLPVSSRLSVVASAGAGICFGTLEQTEDYEVETGFEEALTGGGMTRISTGRYAVEGAYRDRTTARALDAAAGLGVEWRLGDTMSLTAGIAARRAVFGNWRGDGRDEFEWEWTAGESGEEITSSGREGVGATGRLWFVESADARAAVPYPKLLLTDDEPLGPDVLRSRPARISLTGVSVRVGIKFAL